MADIEVHRAHGLGLDGARAAADRMMEHLAARFGLRGTWEGNVLRFDRAGVSGHLGDFNDLSLIGTLSGVEMGLELAGVPHKKGGVQAAMDYLVEAARKSESQRRAA